MHGRPCRFPGTHRATGCPRGDIGAQSRPRHPRQDRHGRRRTRRLRASAGISGLANPLLPGFTPGGSSSGSAAAVAAGFCALALGTDTMGSVRIPAACCGVAGLKPTAGLIPRTGVLPLSATLDCVGVLAHDPRDAAALIALLASFDPEDLLAVAAPANWCPGSEEESATSGAPPQVGILDLAALGPLDNAVRDALIAACAALEASGVVVTPIEIPGWRPPETRRAALLIAEAEASVAHAALIDQDTAASESYRARSLSAGRQARLNWWPRWRSSNGPGPESGAHSPTSTRSSCRRSRIGPFLMGREQAPDKATSPPWPASQVCRPWPCHGRRAMADCRPPCRSSPVPTRSAAHCAGRDDSAAVYWNLAVALKPLAKERLAARANSAFANRWFGHPPSLQAERLRSVSANRAHCLQRPLERSPFPHRPREPAPDGETPSESSGTGA